MIRRRHVRTKQAILDAALEIVIQNGPAALSMRSLAERIDYSPAGLYEYFSSKEEIISAVCDEGQRMLYAAWTLVHGIAMLRITALRPYPIDLATFDDEALRNFMRGLQVP